MLCEFSYQTPAAGYCYGLSISRYAVGLVAGVVLCWSALASGSLRDSWERGLGAVSTDSLVGITSHGILTDSVLANLPQLVFALLYPLQNTLYTYQLVGYEWSLFGQRHQPLPCDHATGTADFNLLPRPSVLVLLSALDRVHIISQSIFLVYIIKYYDYLGHDTHRDVSQCGYSTIGALLSVIIATLTFVAGILNGMRTYPASILVVGTCSFAISAACHVPPAEMEECPDLACQPLRWGVTDMNPKGISHCSCTHYRSVASPTKEGLYAGIYHNGD